MNNLLQIIAKNIYENKFADFIFTNEEWYYYFPDIRVGDWVTLLDHISQNMNKLIVPFEIIITRKIKNIVKQINVKTFTIPYCFAAKIFNLPLIKKSNLLIYLRIDNATNCNLKNILSIAKYRMINFEINISFFGTLYEKSINKNNNTINTGLIKGNFNEILNEIDIMSLNSKKEVDKYFVYTINFNKNNKTINFSSMNINNEYKKLLINKIKNHYETLYLY